MMFALAFLLAAAGQAAQPTQGDEIVVTGVAPPPAPKAAQEFVRDVTQRSFDQVPRYHGKVCPVIVGLQPDAASVVRERILETAKGVGAKADSDPRCLANLVVVVTESGLDFVNALRQTKPNWFRGLSPVEIRRIVKEPSPVRAWSVTSIRNEDRNNVVTPAYGDSYTMRVSSASILKLPTLAEIEGSIIVIDSPAVIGLSLPQIADYAAMRGLARTIPPRSKGVNSILNLFEPTATRQPELTRSDIIYLQALYSLKGTENAMQTHGRISRELQKNGRRR